MMGAGSVTGEPGALSALALWLEGLVFSPVTTSLAIIAIAATGLSMLSGRLPMRRGLTVVLGCFVLFGAPAIARGIVGSAEIMIERSAAVQPSPVPPVIPAKPISPSTVQPLADPYAGASVPG